jgi:hypothetical protein
MWYTSYDSTYRNDGDYYVCYATSDDGVHWRKPQLGIVKYGEDAKNNIIGHREFGSGVFLDPEAPAEERFKSVFIHIVKDECWICGATSGDGIHWKRIAEPLLKKNSDTDNVCFRDGGDGGVYRMYVRMWTQGLYRGRRVVGYTESKTFSNFPDPRVILAPDEQDAKDVHFYNSAASKLGEGLYVMFPSAYTTGDDLVRPLLAVSRDGVTWQRIGRTPAIELGKGFDRSCIYVVPAPTPAEKPGEWWFYYNGSSVSHNANTPDKAKFDGAIGRFRIKATTDEHG